MVQDSVSALRSLPRRAASLGDGAFAALAGAAALAVYGLTLFPGVTAMGDSPKFQYLGRLLGTAHEPGYPLYLLLTWAFSFVPIGTVAFRVNLFSAVTASLATGFLFLALRRLGCPRPVAAAAALACAFGNTFWSQAVRAEVYALSALLLAGFLLAVFRWQATRRWPHLLLAIAIASLALGNHLTITLIAPAAVIYAVWVDRRQALRPSTLLAGAGLVLLGLSQYLYILVRTRQHARFLEASAHNLRQLVEVVRGSQFQQSFFGFGLHQVFTDRIPLVARLFLEELNPAGLALLLVALLVMLRRRPKEAVFLIAAASAVLFFALTYDVPDTEVFLIPAFVLAWVVVGWGVASMLPARGPARRAAVALLWLALPAANLALNYRANDGHARREDIEFFRNFFRQLPARVAIPGDTNDVNWMLTYYLEVEHANGPRDVQQIVLDTATVRRYAARGYEVYVFGLARNELQEQGMVFAPVKLGRRSGDTVNMNARPVFRLAQINGCALVGSDGWSDLTDVGRRAKGRLLLRLQDESREASLSLQPELGAGAAPPLLARPRSAVASWAGAGQPLELRLRPGPLADVGEWRQNAWNPSVLVDLGGVPNALRVRTAAGQSMAICDDPLIGRELLGGVEGQAEIRARVEDEVFFGRGWRLPEPRTTRRVAFGGTAQLAVPLAAPQAIRISFLPASAVTAAEREQHPGSARLIVNGRSLGPRPVVVGSALAWDVGADAWRAGLNDVTLELGPTAGAGRVPLLAVEGVRFERR